MPTPQVLAALKKVVSGLSPVLYHYTDISRAGTILSDDRFKLGTSVGTEAEEEVRCTGCERQMVCIVTRIFARDYLTIVYYECFFRSSTCGK